MKEYKKDSVEMKLDNGNLQFHSEGIVMNHASPSATILVGNTEEEVKLIPNSNPQKSQTFANTFVGKSEENNWEWHYENGFVLSWTIGILENMSGFIVRSSFYNGSKEQVRLKEFSLLNTADSCIQCEGDSAKWYLSTFGHSIRIENLANVLRSVNDETNEIRKAFGLEVSDEVSNDEKDTDGRWRIYNDSITLFHKDLKNGLVAAAIGEPISDVRFGCKVDDGKIFLDVVGEMNNVIVESGQTHFSQEVVFLFEQYDCSVEKIFRWWASSLGSRTHRAPITGWCSWYDKGQYITSKLVCDVIDTFEVLKDSVSVDVIQIDDGFQKHIGDWSCNEQFPEGWDKIISKIKKVGAIPGIWLAPLAVHDSLGILEKHPDWFQRDTKGELIGCAENWGEPGHWLDPTHPEAQSFLREIIRQQIGAGFRYIKIDFNVIHGNCRFYDPNKTKLQAYRDLYKLYREEMGEDCYLLSCSGFTRGTMGYADASRIGTDSTAVWKADYPCTISEAIRGVGFSAIANGIIYSNDPDVTYLKCRTKIFNPADGKWNERSDMTPLSKEELKTWHSMVGLLGGMAMVSEPMYEQEVKDNIRSLAILTPPSKEKGRSFYAATDFNHTRFGYSVKRAWGNFACIMLWNDKEIKSDLSIRLSDVEELQCLGNKVHIWSFWDEKYLGIFDDIITIKDIVPHGCVVLRLTPVLALRETPILVGSSLHISMGAVEISDIMSSRDKMIINLIDGGSKDGNLYIKSEKSLSLDEVEGLRVEAIEQIASQIWKILISDRKRGIKQSIKLSL